MNNDAEKVIMDTQLTRPYTATGGRTRSTAKLDWATMVCSTRRFSPRHVDADHAEVLLLCSETLSVSEVVVHAHLPFITVCVLLSDLIDMGALQANAPATYDDEDLDANREILERLLAGLKRRL